MSIPGRSLFIFLLITVGLTGCTTVGKLAKPLPQGSRVAVISNFRERAVFQRVGTVSADNVSFYRRIPGLHFNSLITSIVANDLYKSRQFRIIPIYHRPRYDLLSMGDIAKRRVLLPQVQSFISRMIASKRIDAVILVVPDFIDFGDGQYFGSIWWASGYGLFNRAFLFMQANIVFSAYKVYVIDAHTYRVLAKSKGSFRTRAHGIDIAWRKGYAGMKSSTLKVVKKILHKQVSSRLPTLVHQTGLP